MTFVFVYGIITNMKNRKSRVIVCVLTHEPATCVRSLILFAQADLIIIYLPEVMKADLEVRIATEREKGVLLPKIEVVTHCISLLDGGVPQMGLLRFNQQRLLQLKMNEEDIGWLSDHDVKLSAAVVINSELLKDYHGKEAERVEYYKACKVYYEVKPNWGARYNALTEEQREECDRRNLNHRYSFPLTSECFISNALLLSKKARRMGLNFFCFGYSNSSHNIRAMKGGYHLVPTWSGLVGLFKDSPNYYDPNITIGSDADVQYHIISECKALGVLCDPCTIIQMELKKEKYIEGPQHIARINNGKKIMARYNTDVCIICRWKQGKDLRCGLHHLEYTGVFGKC